MTPEVILVSADPRLHSGLIRLMAADGIRISPASSVEEAALYLKKPGLSAAAVIVDFASSYGNQSGGNSLDRIAELSFRLPGLAKLVFDPDMVDEDGGDFTPELGFHIFPHALTDRQSYGMISEVLRETIDSLREPSEKISGLPGSAVPGAELLDSERREDGLRSGRELNKSFSDGGLSNYGIGKSGALGSENSLQGRNSDREISDLDQRNIEKPESSGNQRREAERIPVPLYSDAFLRRVAMANVPVLLHGETGVGKEVMAKRLWSYSARANKPFLKLNCAALPSELIESELFGYEKGAFTGATIDKVGKFEMAQNGTILLDEIGDMDVRLQAKLLQVLQDGEVQPLGSSRTINVNVRVMAATHRDLRRAIEEGSFREDLYYRLSVINLTIPPLRERRDEILTIAGTLLLRHLPEGMTAPVITPPLERAMLAYSWPGNVRELENMMRRYLVYQDPGLLAAELTEYAARIKPGAVGTESVSERDESLLTQKGGEPISVIGRLKQASKEAESRLLLEALESARWNRRKAAHSLNIDYKAFLYKLQKYGIAPSGTRRKSKGDLSSIRMPPRDDSEAD